MAMKSLGKPSAQEVHQSSANALKMVYYVVIGLAIVEALQRAFLQDGSFLGWQIFASDNLPSTLLLFALLPTICRFIHGASIHLDTISSKRFKSLFDFIAFFMQASCFYLMAISLREPIVFSFFFALMLLSDAIWLIFLRNINYIQLDVTEKQWLKSDSIMIISLILFHVLIRTMALVFSAFILMIAITATICDYHDNKEFYFPAGPSKR